MKNAQKAHTCIMAIMAIASMISHQAAGQTGDSIVSEQIAVVARPSNDSISLRWAPLNYRVWQSGNISGYRIERHLLARNGTLILPPEKIILHTSLRPLPETDWESLVTRDKYAAIAAQAIFGDRFEVDLKQSDIFSVVNKVRENEQRFAFALFSADMSPKAAAASGLWFTDRQVKKGEKYLYRVVVNSMDSLRGSVFISPDEPYHLPKPGNLKGEFKDQLASLKWEKNAFTNYTAYVVERSPDGKHFKSISASPLVTVSPTQFEDTRYEYAVDSLRDLSRVYYYRVKGVTPFGEEGPPSDVVSGKGIPSVNQVPYISSAENKLNTSILIEWDFPEISNNAITGFEIERSSEPKEGFLPLTQKLLSAEVRSFEDRLPHQVNYYRITAHGVDGGLYPSPIYFAQLVDSIPPSSPSGLKAKIDDTGKVILSWKHNTEADIYGYRIYKAYHLSEELAQVTSEPVVLNTFTDEVNLKTLNEHVIYSVMAIDINQNHSSLSTLLKVELPDKVRPQAPTFLPVVSNGNGISLRWTAGGSEDIVQYKVFRKLPHKHEWEQLSILKATADALYQYEDSTAVAGLTHYYTVVSEDDAGLESEPANVVSGTRINNRFRPAIMWKKPRINKDESEITLVWDYKEPQVGYFKIFRAVDDAQPVLFKTIKGKQNEFTDVMIPGKRYQYRIMALFEDGKKSSLSDAITYQY